jgi:hypothetical protein
LTRAEQSGAHGQPLLNLRECSTALRRRFGNYSRFVLLARLHILLGRTVICLVIRADLKRVSSFHGRALAV